jgi:hypothetical protein
MSEQTSSRTSRASRKPSTGSLIREKNKEIIALLYEPKQVGRAMRLREMARDLECLWHQYDEERRGKCS